MEPEQQAKMMGWWERLKADGTVRVTKINQTTTVITIRPPDEAR